MLPLPSLLMTVAAAAGGGGGLDATNTRLLLHMDGADASTTFIDSSAYAHTMVTGGLAEIDTDQSVFGGASCYLTGSSGFVYTQSGDNADFEIGANEFALFCWIRPSSLGNRYLISKGYTGTGSSRNHSLQITSAGALKFEWSNNGTATTGSITSASSLIQTNMQQLVGVTRDASGTIRLFHGLITDTNIVVAASLNDATTAQTFWESGTQKQVAIGATVLNSFRFAGHIDEAIYMVGEPLHSADFARPTVPWTVAA